MIRLSCPAKVNINLAITGKRADGYHLLDSLVTPVNWYDYLEIGSADKLRFTQSIKNTTDIVALPADEENLVVKAARAIADFAGLEPQAHIHLHKHLPSGAGLGGGSSDAAACLRGLNRLWNLGLSNSVLRSIALPLGADVPFFIDPVAARMQGAGERLTKVTLEPHILLLLIPKLHCDTALVYQTYARLGREAQAQKSPPQLTNPDKGVPFTALCEAGNHLKEAILTAYPGLGKLISQLPEAPGWQFSGSGGCLFRYCASIDHAHRLASTLVTAKSLAGIRISTRIVTTISR